jgi:hypothetical protein
VDLQPNHIVNFSEISRGQLVAGPIVAGIAASPLMVAITLMDGGGPFKVWTTVIVVVASVLVWVLLGTLFLISLPRVRASLRRRDCLGLGACLAMITPYVAVQTAMILGPLLPRSATAAQHIHQLQPVDIGFVTYFSAGVADIPSGLLGGWVLWRLLARHVDAPSDFAPVQRDEVLNRKVLVGLVVAPLLPATVVYAIFLFTGDKEIFLFTGGKDGPGFAAFILGWCIGAAELLSLGGGLGLLLLSVGRKPIRRGDCLLMGAGHVLFLPAVTYVVGGGLHVLGAPITIGPSGFRQIVGQIAGYLILGDFLLPVGLISGWLLWRIAFKDTQPVPVHISSVFR